MNNKPLKEISLEELHKYYYERFAMLHEFLLENNIEYFAVGGTLLGAIRHNGIIPWDDDMDIAMTRENYERFVRVCHNLDSRYLKASNYRFSKRTEHAIVKLSLVGLRRKTARFNTEIAKDFHIDVFPMDYVSKDEDIQSEVVKKIKKLIDRLYYKSRSFSGNSFIRKIALLVMKAMLLFVSSRSICKKIDELASSQNNSDNVNKSILWTSSGVYSYEKEIHSVSCFGRPKIHTFGSTVINVPENYHDFLVTTYGKDYMNPYIRHDNAMEGIYICEDFNEIEK